MPVQTNIQYDVHFTLLWERIRYIKLLLIKLDNIFRLLESIAGLVGDKWARADSNLDIGKEWRGVVGERREHRGKEGEGRVRGRDTCERKTMRGSMEVASNLSLI